ncbi:MAG TPA: GPP34 family phosphoprotein [Phytomonospora sp.]
MANLLEEVVLLAYRDDKGRNAVPYLQWSLAGAALLELALRGRVAVDDSGRLDVVDPTPVGDPAVDEALARLSRSRVRHIPSSWVQILAGVELRALVLDGLVDRGVLTHDRGRALGIVPVDRYRPVDPGVEAEVRARLDRAFREAAGTDARTAALAGIAGATFMEPATLPEEKPGAVTAAFRELADRFAEVKPFVDGVRLAITVFRAGAGSVVTGS